MVGWAGVPQLVYNEESHRLEGGGQEGFLAEAASQAATHVGLGTQLGCGFVWAEWCSAYEGPTAGGQQCS